MFRLRENAWTGTEDQMVKLFIEKYKETDLIFGHDFIRGKYYEQVHVPEINRRSDLVIVAEKRLINIEFKLGDHKCLMKQAEDHMRWADYNYVCVPINFLRIYPVRFVPKLLEKKIGLLACAKGSFVEIFRAKHNTYKAGKEKPIRENVLKKLSGMEPVYVEGRGNIWF